MAEAFLAINDLKRALDIALTADPSYNIHILKDIGSMLLKNGQLQEVIRVIKAINQKLAFNSINDYLMQ